MCILSHFPFFTFFSQFLREVYRITIQSNSDIQGVNEINFMSNSLRCINKYIKYLLEKIQVY